MALNDLPDDTQHLAGSATHRDRPSKPSPWLVLAGSLFAMLPWPTIAIGVCLVWSQFEDAPDAMLLFGGVTLIFLLPLVFLGAPEWLFAVLIGIVWSFVLVVPAWSVLRGMRRYSSVALMLLFQIAFAAFQAGLGLLMIWTKEV